MQCISKDTIIEKYPDLKKSVDENYALLASQVMWYQDHFNRFPYSDELMGIDPNITIQYIYGLIKSNPERYESNSKNSDVDIALGIHETESEFKKLYGELTPQDVQQQLNRTYPNVITKINKYGNTLQIQSVPAPSRFVNIDSVVKPEIAPNIVNSDIWNRVFNELEDKFGFHLIGYSAESNLTELGINDVPDALENKGFIRRNAIYVNTTTATVDTPIHELIHLLLAEIKFSRPMEYYELVNNFRANQNPDLTPLQREEKFVDYILNGQISVGNYDIWKNVIDSNAQLSIKDLARSVGSALLSLADDNTMTKVEIHSVMLNTKEALIKDKKLTQECK